MQVRDSTHAGVGQLACVDQSDTTTTEALTFFTALKTDGATCAAVAAVPISTDAGSTSIKLLALVYACEDGVEEGFGITHDSTGETKADNRVQMVSCSPSVPCIVS